MSEKKNFSVLTDEDGYVIINGIAGKEFISTEPIVLVNGKFRVKDFLNLVFEEA